jgi:hypothetical protein
MAEHSKIVLVSKGVGMESVLTWLRHNTEAACTDGLCAALTHLIPSYQGAAVMIGLDLKSWLHLAMTSPLARRDSLFSPSGMNIDQTAEYQALIRCWRHTVLELLGDNTI